MIRSRVLLLALACALSAAALFAAGCGVKGTMGPNTPPETIVFVEGPVDTVNHVVTLRWFGSDPDGVGSGSPSLSTARITNVGMA